MMTSVARLAKAAELDATPLQCRNQGDLDGYGFGRGWTEQIYALAHPAGLLGLAGQILFAVSPLMRHRERLQDRAS